MVKKTTLRFLFLLLALLGHGAAHRALAQTVFNTTTGTGYTGNNNAGAGYAITFVIANNSSGAMLLTDISNWYASGNNGNVELWYSSTSLSGTYGTLATPTWTQITTGTEVCTTTGVTPITWNALSFTIPVGATYRFALLSASNCVYSGTSSPYPTPNTFTSGGISLYVGDYQIASANVGYGATNNPRFFTGSVTLTPATACVAPPTPGTATASLSSLCLGATTQLGLTGNSVGVGQTYQWQSSTSATGTFTNVGPAASTPTYTATPAAVGSTYYRCQVSCSSNSAYSSVVQVLVPNLFPGGTYTINSASTTSGTNFASFSDAVSAIACGISGPVVFNVAANSTYNEQVSIPNISTTSATNTVTFNCNNATLSYTNANAANYGIFTLNGADYITVKKLNVSPSSTATYGIGFLIANDADYNTIDSCTVTNLLTSTSSNFSGVCIGSSLVSPTAAGTGTCDYNTLKNSTITGGYYAVTNVGSSTAQQYGTKIQNNVIKDFYVYGTYNVYNTGVLLQGNELHRLTRATVSTFYGLFLSTGTTACTVTQNKVHDPFGAATTSASAAYVFYNTGTSAAGSDNVWSNNTQYSLNGNGTIYCIYSIGDFSKWYYNSICADNSTATTGATYGFYQSGALTSVESKNNIILITRAGTGVKYCVYHSSTGYTNVHNYNVYYSSSSNAFYNGAALTNLASWQSSVGQDANSVFYNPAFTNTATGDLTPTLAAINNAATPIGGITVDILGATRNTTTPDPGAFEFTIPGCTAPPTAGTSTASLTSVCSGANVTLDLSGNSVGLNQTYVWQYATTATGSYTSIGSASATQYKVINPTTTYYYRAAVTCGASTVYSTPVLVTVAVLFPAGTYTINSGAATAGTNFNSFTAAANAIACGIAGPIVFNVTAGSGPYNEQVSIFSLNTSATNTVTFNCNNVTLGYTNTNAANYSILKLDGADYIKFKKLNVVPGATGTYGYGILLTNGADNNTIDSCTVSIATTLTSSNFSGIVIGGSGTSATSAVYPGNNNVISNNTVTGGYYGITNIGLSNIPQTGTQIINNVIGEFYVYGVYNLYSTSGLIEKNEIHRSTRAAVSTFYGIALSSGCTNMKVSKNRIHDPFTGVPTATSTGYVLYNLTTATSGQENVFVNNVLYNLSGNGAFYCFYNSSGGYSKWYHNTINADNADATTTSGATYGFYSSGSAAGIVSRNNIISISRAGTGVKYVVYNVSTGYPNVYSNNLYYTTGSGFAYNGGAIASLAAWQTATNQDLNSVNQDPQFLFAPFGDMTPAAGGIDNIGTPVGVTTDIVSVGRSTSAPDAGAYEFGFIPLTIKLLNFDAKRTGDDAIAYWKTASEVAADHYEVERSVDAKLFVTAGVLKAAGNSADIKEYSYTDTRAIAQLKGGNTLYYRLKMVNMDGSSSYSNIAPVRFDANSNNGFYLTATPNPFVDKLTVNCNLATAGNATIQLMSVDGKLLSTTVKSLNQGDNSFALQGLNNLPNGVYELNIEINGKLYTQKLSK